MYRSRFIKAIDEGELINLYHLAQVPLSGYTPKPYDRMIWATNSFHQTHPEISKSGIYKDLCGLIGR